MMPFPKTLKVLNDISPSFCAAKWYKASIWLGNGKTASCHHPLAHKIPLEELKNNPSALHNTQFKKERRSEMLAGIRPDECSYCWVVEDAAAGNPVYSDRVHKSGIYTEKQIKDIVDLDVNENIDPLELEICFDSLCNLNCSYCNSQFSSTWTNDIAKNGPYENMITGGGRTYSNTLEQIKEWTTAADDETGQNPYIKAFFTWFHESLKNNLRELRVSGGEPSRSPWFWKLLDECEDPKFNFAVNSNLIMDLSRLEKLEKAAKKFKKFEIYTSAECFGKHQEFVRHNFKWDTWVHNLRWLADKNINGNIHIMMTISALSVWSVDEFLNFICNLRKEYPNSKNIFHMSVNILRFPSFQSVNNIPLSYKLILAESIQSSIEKNSTLMSYFEINQFERLVLYLREVETSYEDKDGIQNKLQDFHNFILQYSQRNNMDLVDYMPENFINWWKEICTLNSKEEQK